METRLVLIPLKEIEKALLKDFYWAIRFTKISFSNIKLNDINGLSVKSNGDKRWYKNGRLHRENGPAVECTNGKYWVVNGVYHRSDGPAVKYNDGTRPSNYWYLYGVHHTERDYKELLGMLKTKSITDTAKLLAKEQVDDDYHIETIYLIPNDKEVRLIVVTSSVQSCNEILPFRFPEDPPDILFKYIILCINPEDWARRNELQWSKDIHPDLITTTLYQK